MTKALRPVPRPTLLGVAPPRAGSAPEPTRSLTPTGRYRVKVQTVETIRVERVKR